MRHIIVTKFSVDDGTGRCNDEEWLKDRMKLFKQWTLPSIMGQTVQDFTWITYHDETNPQWFKDEMNAIGYDNLKPFFVDREGWLKNWKTQWFSEIRKYIEPGILFTTRIDSDDAVRNTYIEMCRDFSQCGSFTQPLTGYMCRDGMVYKRRYPLNPFATYKEFVGDIYEIETVNKFQHCHIPSGEMIYTEVPGWIQHAHENTGWNKFTIVEDSDWIPLDDVKKDFNICV